MEHIGRSTFEIGGAATSDWPGGLLNDHSSELMYRSFYAIHSASDSLTY